MIAVSVEHLSKRYRQGRHFALRDVSFSVREGEVFGLLGPNGAGKTTIIKILTTLLRPSRGRATVAGRDVRADARAVRQAIGLVFQETIVDDDLTAFDNLDLHARFYGIAKAARRRQAESVLALVGLQGKEKQRVRDFSGGMQRRLEIARGLMHEPKVLFLDEPTTGLDPRTRHDIWAYIKKLCREKNITIILTTHYLEEADFLCDRVAILDEGKLVVNNTPEFLKNEVGGDVLTIELGDTLAKIAPRLRELPFVSALGVNRSAVCLTVREGERHIAEIVQLVQESRGIIHSLALRKPTLDDVYLHYVGKTLAT